MSADPVPVVELDEVSRVHPGDPPVHALRPCSLTVAAGDYVAITGPSGSGKSTLLNLLGLLDEITSGRYLLHGQDVSRLDEARRAWVRNRRIGFVFQAFHLISYRTSAENVEIPMLYASVPRRERRRRAEEALRRVGLGHRLDAFPPTLSGGERQRVAIARALITDPGLLLCDEPTGNLDSTTTSTVLELLEELNEGGLTIVIVTHEQEVADRARRQIHIRDGVAAETGRAR